MLGVAALVVVVLLVFASGYGYHRDELYFLAAGRHLDWAYADQGPLTPLVAAAMSAISATSLTVLRIPSALAAAVTVVLTGLLTREFGGSRRAELIAAGCAAVSNIVLFDGHLLGTSTVDLLAWTAVCWLAVRAVRTGDERLWLAVGVVLGVGLLTSRYRRSSRWVCSPVWLGALIATGLWMPWIVWQAAHGRPQLAVSDAIAAGRSTSSQPWWAIVPFQFLLASPVLAPVWIAGLVRLFRDPTVRRCRFVAWAWVLLAVVFMATGGKPYYLAGLLPALLAAGAGPVDGWLDRARTRLRRGVLSAAVALSTVVNVTIALLVLAANHAGPVIALNAAPSRPANGW